MSASTRFDATARTLRRGLIALLVTAVVSTLTVGLVGVPGLPGPTAALAQTAPNPRLCSGVAASGVFHTNYEQKLYDLYVPQGATVTLDGTVDTPNNWVIAFTVNPFGGWQLSGGHASFSGTYTNTGGPGFVEVRLDAGGVGNLPETWQFTVTVAGGGCVSPSNTYGSQCAAPHLDAAQGLYGDPVNAATGNVHEDFTDFDIPARGPGLALSHSYNSGQAATDGPLGFGWTHSFAESLAVDAAGVVTVTQEGGATLPFSPLGSGGFTAPPWAVASLVHNADGSYTMARCNEATFQFSPGGQLTSITDRNGNATTLQYSAGRLATVTDSAGRQLHVNWTGTHITSVSDSSSPARTISFGYNDGGGNLTDYTDVGGATWRFTYVNHRLTTVRRPNQAGVPTPPVTTNVYDGQGRVVSQTDELGRQTLFDYTSIASSTKVTDPKGNVIVEEYQGLLRRKLIRGYGTSTISTWLFNYDGTAGISKLTDPNGSVTTATYDLDGNRLTLTDALGRTTAATYNAFDEPLTVTDATLATTTYEYDSRGNVTKASTPVRQQPGQTQVTQYVHGDAAHPGDLTSVIDPNGKIWTRTYEANTGYLRTETDPLGDETRYGYNPATGWLTSTVSPRGRAAGVDVPCAPPALGCTTVAHDAWGHVTVTTDGNGNQTTDHYDSDGNLDFHVDGDGDRTNYVFDAADQLTTEQRPGGTSLLTHYWPDGSTKDTVDGAGKTTSYAYDTQGRLSSTTDPDTRTTAYGYDLAGDVVSKADPGGTCPVWSVTSWPPALSPTSNCRVMAYDAAGELKSVTYSDGVTPDVTAIGYDAAGRRTSMTQDRGGAASAWAWDDLGRMTSSTTAGRQVTYQYLNTRDPATAIVYPGTGRTLSQGYDDAGRLTTITDWLGNATHYQPTADSDVGAVTPSGTGLTDTFGYDNAGAVSGITTTAGASTVAGLTYGRDAADQVTSVATTGTANLSDTHSYSYSPLDQLAKQDSVTTWAYDPADNLTAMAGGTTLANYSNANQVGTRTRATNATTFGYDTRGNRTSASPAVGSGTAYAYDQANRLASADPTSFSRTISAGWWHSMAARSDGTAWTWGYNAMGQLGNNATTDSWTPIQVPGLTGVVAVAAASYESVALKGDGTVWSWGWNSNGQLGDGTTTDRHAPVQVQGLSGVVAVAAGTSHYLALKGDGTVWAWGYNSNGQLGNGTTADSAVPVQVQGLTDVVAIAGGYTHSVALKGDGTVWSWGYNGLGQLGNNSTVQSLVPVQAQGLSGVAAIAAGYHHTLAVKGDGTAWAWGYNANGQLGTNSTANSSVPVQVPGLAGVKAVAAGGYTSMAQKADGSVLAWGYNANGLLADGTTTDRWTPQAVGALAGAKGLATGPIHALSLRPDGTLRAWGEGGAGELGRNSTDDSLVPVAVASYNRGSTPMATYSYDGTGLRSSKTVAGVTTTFSWDQSAGVPLLLDDGTNAYVYGPDGLPLEQIGPANAVRWYHHDQLGSTRVLSNGSGATVATATYDPYGRLKSSTGTLSPIGFAGEYTDAETGFVYLRARYYDPATGQFISRDPLTAVTGEPYGYVGGNPLNATDPTGLFSYRHAFALTAAVAGAVAVGAAIVAALPGAAAGAAGTALIAGSIAVGSTAAVMVADCRKAVDADCVIDGVAVAVGAISLGLGTASFMAGRGTLGVLGLEFREGFDIFSAAFGGASGLASFLGLPNPHGKRSRQTSSHDCTSIPSGGPGLSGFGTIGNLGGPLVPSGFGLSGGGGLVL